MVEIIELPLDSYSTLPRVFASVILVYISPLGMWGSSVVGFASEGSIYPDFQSIKNTSLAWAIGGGSRFLLFPKKDVYNRVDVA